MLRDLSAYCTRHLAEQELFWGAGASESGGTSCEAWFDASSCSSASLKAGGDTAPGVTIGDNSSRGEKNSCSEIPPLLGKDCQRLSVGAFAPKTDFGGLGFGVKVLPKLCIADTDRGLTSSRFASALEDTALPASVAGARAPAPAAAAACAWAVSLLVLAAARRFSSAAAATAFCLFFFQRRRPDDPSPLKESHPVWYSHVAPAWSL